MNITVLLDKTFAILQGLTNRRLLTEEILILSITSNFISDINDFVYAICQHLPKSQTLHEQNDIYHQKGNFLFLSSQNTDEFY